MATSLVSIIPECSICLKTPKILPCGHTFCLGCLEILISDKTNTFPCPICQQNVKIPKGGAKMFTTNFILQTSKHTTQVKKQPPSTTQPRCPNHNQREVDYYCNDCNIGLCSKCIFKQHKYHETLDSKCDETRSKAIENLERSQNIIQNRIKNLEKTRCTLLESFEQLKTLCENSCTRVTAKTEQIVSDVRQRCEQIIKDIGKNLKENKSKVEDREMEIVCEINRLERNSELNISPSSKSTLNILQTLPRLVEIEKQSRKENNMCLQYLQWGDDDDDEEADYSDEDDDDDEEDEKSEFILKQLGSVISKPFYIPGSYQFLYDLTDVENSGGIYYHTDKFRNNKVVWSCGARRHSDGLFIYIKLLPDDSHKVDYCIIDYQISVLNFDDDSKTKTKTIMYKRLKRGSGWSWFWRVLPWSKFDDKNNGYINSNGQFLVRFYITQISEISWK